MKTGLAATRWSRWGEGSGPNPGPHARLAWSLPLGEGAVTADWRAGDENTFTKAPRFS